MISDFNEMKSNQVNGKLKNEYVTSKESRIPMAKPQVSRKQPQNRLGYQVNTTKRALLYKKGLKTSGLYIIIFYD